MASKATLSSIDWEAVPIRKPEVIGSFNPTIFATKEGTERVGRELCEFATRIWQTTGQLSQHLLIYCMRDPWGEVAGPVVVLTGVKPGKENMSGVTKEAAAQLTAATAEFGQARAVANLCEMWFFRSEDPSMMERLNKWRASHNGSFEGCPGVEDIAQVHLETARGMRFYRAPILTDILNPGMRRLGPFTDEGYLSHMQGRYTHLLQPPEKKPS